MQNERAAPYGDGKRGAGGKFAKPPARKPPATPYDRPLVSQSAGGRDGGWLSKLVDPARRLISSGATRMLPSIFSRSPSTPELNGMQCQFRDLLSGGLVTLYLFWIVWKERNRAFEDAECVLVWDKAVVCLLLSALARLGTSISCGEAGPSKVEDKSKSNTESDKLEREDGIQNLCDDSELSKIEHLVKGKKFSRDEISRLTEILNSRVENHSAFEGEKKRPSLITGVASGPLSANESPRTLAEKKQMRDEIPASPVDIARAYMESRTSETGLGSYSTVLNGERTLRRSDEFASKPFFPPPSPRSSTCWPGAMLEDQRTYMTPQSQRGRYGLHSFPQTPYSRTLLSKSKTKLTQSKADSESLNILSTPFQQSRTPIFGQVKSRSDVDGGYRSVGPIRRLRNKFASEASPRGSSSLYTVQYSPSEVDKSNVSKSFLPTRENNLELGGVDGTSNCQSVDHTAHSTEEGIPNQNTPSSQAVRRILEHLDRHKPTPKEKAAELKLATEWKKNPPSEYTDVTQKASTSLGSTGGFDMHKTRDSADQCSAEGNSNFKVKCLDGDVGNAVFKASTNSGDASITRDAIARPFGFKNINDSQERNIDENAFMGTNNGQKDTSLLWPFHNQVNGQSVTTTVPVASGSKISKKTPSQSSGTRPTLQSIAISKPDPRSLVYSDNGLGFSFPISASASALAEPPTPSIMPSFMTSGLAQAKEGPAVPSFSFGTKKTTPPLVFSFPSTSGASTRDEVADLKFDFGSDKKNRVSFRSVGKDAICY
ncbi:hypothetical protein RJ640_010033 [Escallonia rubra]|uniref:Nuclear pore complex protein NUP1 n=1 Tax=Escallonia rubra TaxID=112253 RepID=A0AA88QKE5_9ASTE|nr:hypothetical protein RJ640_010033 [Escallonia rubra]